MKIQRKYTKLESVTYMFDKEEMIDALIDYLIKTNEISGKDGVFTFDCEEETCRDGTTSVILYILRRKISKDE